MPIYNDLAPLPDVKWPDFLEKKLHSESNYSDITLLRKEIAELRALLTPSTIIIGQRVIDDYYKIVINTRG